MKNEVERNYGITIRKIGSIGISAMMHGYMAFDKTGSCLFRFELGVTQQPVLQQKN